MFGAGQDGAPCTQRSVNLGEPGRDEGSAGRIEMGLPSVQRLWSGCSDRTWCLFSGDGSVLYNPPMFVGICILDLVLVNRQAMLKEHGCWRPGPAADALLFSCIFVRSAAYICSCGAARSIVYACRSGC
jgi:hypothetical protein